ncbi:MAG: hypothetical protein DRI46_12165 [Chloroflexi bacterium]|nr:MAG: hypothetical protein DRI46_12165 [Chloroflexota bacterium]
MNSIEKELSYIHRQHGLMVKAKHKAMDGQNRLLAMFDAQYKNYNIINYTHLDWDLLGNHGILFNFEPVSKSFTILPINTSDDEQLMLTKNGHNLVLCQDTDHIDPFFIIFTAKKETA